MKQVREFARRSVIATVGRSVLAVLASLFAWSAAFAQTGIIHVDVHQAEAQTKGDDACFGPWCNEQDFWVQVAFPPTFTFVQGGEIDNRDIASWAPPATWSETVSKLQRFHDVQVELWDKDDTTSDDRFDISPLPPDTLLVHFDACTNTWQQIGLTDKYGPGISHPPYGTRDPEFNGRVVLDVYTDGRLPFTTNDISIAGLDPVQSAFDPESVVSGKPTSMRIRIASSYTGPTPAPAPITINVTDGISNWSETRNLIIPPGLSTFYFFDGMVAGSHAFIPFKPPNVDRANLTYSAHVTYNDVAPPGTPSDFVDCYQANNSVVNKQNPIVRTSVSTVFWFPFEYLDAAPSAPPFADVLAMQQRDEPFRQASWPVAQVSDVVSGLPILPPYPLTFGWFSEPWFTLNGMSLVFGLLGVDRSVLVVPPNFFADNNGRSADWPSQSTGISLGEFAPHAVLIESDRWAGSTHELGHTYKLSQHKCSNGGIAEDVFYAGCRDEYKFAPGDGAPFMASGLDVTGAIFPSGSSDFSIPCAPPQTNTREVCERNIMDGNATGSFVNWLDTFSWNYLAEHLKQGSDPELVSLSGFVHSTNGFDMSQAPVFEGGLDFSYHSFGNPDLPDAASSSPAGGPPLVSGEGRFMVHFATASGDKMYRFDPSFQSEGESTPRDGAYFSFMVPWDPTTTSISLTAPSDARDTDCEDASCHDVVLFARPIHGGPPSVTALRAGLDTPPPLTGPAPAPPTIGPGHNAVVAWSATDPTPGPEGLRSILLLSHVGPGGPDQFLPYDISDPGSQVTIPHDTFSRLPGDYMAQVIVSNGLLSTPLTTGTVFHVCNFSNGAVETCNGIDDNCDGLVDNAPLPGPEQVELNPQPFPPGGAEFDWVADPKAQSYDVVYGNLGGLAASHGNFTTATIGCLADDTTATALGALPTPPVGQGFWFEVRGNNCAGTGTWDSGDPAQVAPRDPGINAAPNTCRPSSPSPELTIMKTHGGNFLQGQQGATYTLVVSNSGPGSTSGTVTVTDTVPSGLTLVSMAGPGWACPPGNTCTRGDVLPGGAGYPPITVTVNVAANASSPQVNQADVSGGGAAFASTSDSTNITTVAPALSITKSHSGHFYRGEIGAVYTVTVSNIGNAPTSGTVTVTDNAPVGLTNVAMSGTGWTCPTPGSTCTRSDALGAGSSYPDLTVSVDVAPDAPVPSLTNQVTASGGGAPAVTANDPTTIDYPLLAILKSHVGNFVQGQQGAVYTLRVQNQGFGPTVGTVTATEVTPPGLTLVSMSGTGWTCPASPGNTCTRSDSLASTAYYPDITVTVNVASNAPSSITNEADITGGGSNGTGKGFDPTTIDAARIVLGITKSHTGNFVQGQPNAPYTVAVRNIGNTPTSGTVTVTENAPVGLTLLSMAGTGWTCPSPGNSCTRSDALAPLANYPDITVTVSVATNAPSSVTNQATVTGGGDGTLHTASDPTTINPGPPVLSLSKTHNGSFSQGQTNAKYTVTITNVATMTTAGPVIMHEMPPPGLTVVSMSGTGWSCDTVQCNRADPLSGGASYPPITVTVSVAATATSPQVNMVHVDGGGAPPVDASDSTTIVPAGVPNLSITKTHTGNFFQGQTNAAYTLTVSNAVGAGTTSGTVTVTDTLPPGLVLASVTPGIGWSCAGLTCMRSAGTIPPGASATPITVRVNVLATASSPQVNQANVSGGGSAPSSTTDPTIITP
jgi:uncharacterized repeat protein (TIGR01451 family)